MKTQGLCNPKTAKGKLSKMVRTIILHHVFRWPCSYLIFTWGLMPVSLL